MDAWGPPQSRLEAYTLALFAVRRAPTQSLMGLTAAETWLPRAGGAILPGRGWGSCRIGRSRRWSGLSALRGDRSDVRTVLWSHER